MVLGSASAALVQDLTPVAWGRTQQVPLLKVFIYAVGCAGSSLWHSGSKARRLSSCSMQASLPSVWGLSSSTRDWTYVPCIARWILNHWTTKEGPQRKFLMHLGVSCSCLISMLILNHVLPQRRLRMFSACCSTPHWNHLDNCQQLSLVRGFPGGAAVKNPPASGRKLRRCGFNPWVEKIP